MMLRLIDLVLMRKHTVPNTRRRTRNRAPASLRLPRLLSVVIIDEQFSLLAIPPRQVLRNLDNIERVRGLVEDLVHLLQASASGFGEEEIDRGYHGEVDYGEDDV